MEYLPSPGVTGGGNGGYDHKSLEASFVDVLTECCVDAELVVLFGHGGIVYQTQPTEDKARRRRTRLGSGRPCGYAAAILRHGSP